VAQTLHETIYIGRDNYIGRLLSSSVNGVVAAADLSTVTRIDVIVGGVLVSSTDPVNGPIKWLQPGYAAGEIRIFAGKGTGLAAAVGLQAAALIVYDPTNPDGLLWDTFSVAVVQI
jgi:hypothetical protein